MLRTSELVTLGHPDKIADYISSHILDAFLKYDPATRYAVEVMIKETTVVLGGEVTSKKFFSYDELAELVKEAVREIGYTREYQTYWGAENTICADDLGILNFISEQSPDIARGLATGWGDQGIFWGMATPQPATDFLPLDYYLARQLLREISKNFPEAGLDMKALVTVDGDQVKKVVAAVPLKEKEKEVADFIKEFCCCNDLTLNGTGAYIQHGPIADCGVTGRKLVVDFYGGNCRIGGGSPWTKDGTKADLTLNLFAREIAKQAAKSEKKNMYCNISCCIGNPEIQFQILDEAGKILDAGEKEITPAELISTMNLDKPIFSKLCRNGLHSLINIL